jgi:hypothetical protein
MTVSSLALTTGIDAEWRVSFSIALNRAIVRVGASHVNGLAQEPGRNDTGPNDANAPTTLAKSTATENGPVRKRIFEFGFSDCMDIPLKKVRLTPARTAHSDIVTLTIELARFHSRPSYLNILRNSCAGSKGNRRFLFLQLVFD